MRHNVISSSHSISYYGWVHVIGYAAYIYLYIYIYIQIATTNAISAGQSAKDVGDTV